MVYTDLFKEPIHENGTSLAIIGENGKIFFSQVYKLGNLYPEADIRIEKDKLHFGNPNNIFICILFNNYLEVYISLLTYQIFSICYNNDYKGLIDNSIGVGSTIRDVINHYGNIVEYDEYFLMVSLDKVDRVFTYIFETDVKFDDDDVIRDLQNVLDKKIIQIIIKDYRHAEI